MGEFECLMWYHAILDVWDNLTNEELVDCFDEAENFLGEWADAIHEQWPKHGSEWFSKPIDW